MKSKIYPAIYRAVHNNEYLYADNDNYYSCERETWNKSGNCDDHENDINITREYLANTYGKVESKEHAEFIIELAEANDLPLVWGDPDSPVKSFKFRGDKLRLFELETNELSDINGAKLITIPLPPKQIQTATSEEEFEMQQIMKNNGDNLVLGCEDSKREEWPQIGDEVIIFNQHNELRGELLALTKEYAIISQHYGEQHLHLSGCKFKKPKTPEEELRDELDECISDFQCQYHEREDIEYERLAGYILSKYNITKKP